MIHGVRRIGNKSLGYIETGKLDESQKVKLKPLYEYFVPADTELDYSAQTQKKNSVLKPEYHA